jgi:hypothetical protein
VLLKGEYTTIQNAIEFSTDIQLELTQFLKSEYQRSTSKNLRKLSDEIQMLIDDYDMQFLKYIYQDTQNKIRRESWSEQHNSIMKHRGTMLGRKSSMIEEMSMARYTDSSIRSEGWSLPYPYDIHFAPLIIPKQTTVNTIILTINETFTILIIII